MSCSRNPGIRSAQAIWSFCRRRESAFSTFTSLLPYSVEMSAVLADHIHQLWLLLMEQYKEKCPGVELAVRSGMLTIEEENL